MTAASRTWRKAARWARSKGYRWGGETEIWPPRRRTRDVQGPPPLQQHMNNMLQVLLNEREQKWQELKANYELTLSLLQDIQKGVVDIQDVYVSDDGWQLIPKEDD